jgi:hypothetical protein
MSEGTYTYWEVVKMEINLFNANGNWVECMRQWFVLVTTILLTFYLLFVIREMRKAQREWDFDQIVLGIELIRVSEIAH